MPPRGGARGARGAGASKLKFQPKSNARRSKEEREAAEKKEQDAIRAEEAAAETERRKAERAARGRGRGRGRGSDGRGRGGAVTGGVSGWMSSAGGNLSGSMFLNKYVEKLPAFTGRGADIGSSDYVSQSKPDAAEVVGVSGGAGSGRTGNRPSGTGDAIVWTPRSEDQLLRRDGTAKQYRNIETINLVSDDEADGDDETEEGQADGKRKTRMRAPQSGLPPVRVARHEHVPRSMPVNIDLDEPSGTKKERTTKATGAEKISANTVRIKTEDDNDEVVVVPKPEPVSPRAKRKTRGRPKEVSSKEPAMELDDDQDTNDPASSPSASRRPRTEVELQSGTEIVRKQPVDRPYFVNQDCNFECLPRPRHWVRKDQIEQWERMTRDRYHVYEELSFPEKMFPENTTPPADAASTLDRISRDLDMTIAGTADDKGKGKEGNQEKADVKADVKVDGRPDRKQDLVYIFSFPPGTPGFEGLQSKKATEQEAQAKPSEDADVSIISRPPSPKTSKRSKSPEATRKKKAGAKSKADSAAASSAKVQVKQEDGSQTTVKVEDDGPAAEEGDGEATAATSKASDKGKKSSTADLSSGYIGDLVVYNTGQVRIDWGGLPMALKMGLESTMLHQVLLTSAPVTRDAAVKAAEEKEAAEKSKKAIKKEKADAAAVTSKSQTSGAAAGTSGEARRRDNGGDEMISDDDDDDDDVAAPARRRADNAADAAKAAAQAGDAARIFAMGSVAGRFTVVPDDHTLFGKRWEGPIQ